MIHKIKKIAYLSIIISYIFTVYATSSLELSTFEDDDNLNSTIEIISNDEDNSIALEEDESDLSSNNQSNKFSWKLHQDDHSLYAHRSLISTANIKHHNELEHQESETTSGSDEKQDTSDEYAALKTVDFAEKEWQLMFRSFDLMYDSVSASILQQIGRQTNLFEEIISRLKPECKRDIYHIRDSVKKHKIWALRMLDSNGKIPSGITYGKFSSPGDYEECLSVDVDELVYTNIASKQSAPEHHKFIGKYCLLDFRLPLPERPRNKLLSIHEPVLDLENTDLAKQFPEIKNYSAYASVFYEVGYMHAFCLPSSCEVTDLTKSVGQALEGLHIIVNNTVDCQVKLDVVDRIRPSVIISMIFIMVLFSNAFFASYIYNYVQDGKTRKDELDKSSSGGGFKNWAKKKQLYAECFSIQSNFNRLTKPDPRGLTFVHYTRIVAMGLTVVTHTAGMGTLQAITKPADASNSEQIFRDLIPQMLANAFTSIQIFFFMAGFMLVISTYPSINREKGHMSFIEYAIKRAIRLMPGIAATIVVNFLWPLFVDGPMLSYFVRLIVVPCESNWWRTLTFLSNFDHVEKMCLRHSYFSASDYQLHLMAFPLLILLYKQPTLALFIAGLLTIAGFVAQVIMILTKTVLPFMMVDYIDKEAFFNVVHYIHHPVWNHMSAFFYGFIIGYLVVKQIRINMSESTVKKLWFTILPAGILSIFAPYFWNHYKRPIYRWQMVLYVLFDRFILLTACAWLSYATMVLGRKPKTSKSSQIEVTKKQNCLPNIVPLEGEEKSMKEKSPIEVKLTQIGDVEQPRETNNQIRLTVTSSATSIPRQRSSPNFLSKEGDENKTATTLRSAISSASINSTSNQKVLSAGGKQEVKENPVVKSEQPARNRSQVVVNNVNTLCLMLSRLTFQLYLFNMVVLWIDVNHSKYFWYFSYYFIITKSFAIYIASSIMATIFFITLESPSLTIYIMWVKSRAQARANKRTDREESSDVKPTTTVEKPQKIQVSSNPSLGIMQTQINKSPELGSYDGLCMQSVPSINKPVFSFIDLSSSPKETQTSDQTRM